MNQKVETIIRQLDLQKHPEGGYFKETYRSDDSLVIEGKKRNVGTAIYFLLPKNVISEWHVVKSDEMWHYYDGESLTLELISPEGKWKTLVLGSDLTNGEEPQQLVPKNWWQRAYSNGNYTLVGCTVNPGFDFEDFQMETAKELAERFPELRKKLLP